jgi:hypothetical protein
MLEIPMVVTLWAVFYDREKSQAFLFLGKEGKP